MSLDVVRQLLKQAEDLKNQARELCQHPKAYDFHVDGGRRLVLPRVAPPLRSFNTGPIKAI